MVGEIIRQGRIVEFRLQGAGGKECLDFRSEVQRTVRRVKVVERFYTEAIASNKEFLFTAVPDREGKHAAQVLHTVAAVLFKQVQNCFRVAVGTIDVMCMVLSSLVIG